MRRGALLALAALVASGEAEGFSRTGGVWRSLPVLWRYNPASVPASLGGEANGRMALEAGLATWASAPCTRFRAMLAGTTTQIRGTTGDRQNTFAWAQSSWPAELGSVRSVIGVTLPVSSGGSNIDADIVFNAVGFTWSLDGRGGTVDAQSISVHEEGHFLGLGHTTVPRESIMFPSYPGRPSRTMSSDDINGVCTLYPGMGTPLPDGGTMPPPDAGPLPDAGPPTDPCNAITSCDECTPQATCGWCAAGRRCMTGNARGALIGTCEGSWQPYPMDCARVPPPPPPPPDGGPADTGAPPPDGGVIDVDPCSGFAACGSCAAAMNCGWCGSLNRCMYATSASGPARGTCPGDWAIEPSQCMTGGGLTMFGGPCRASMDCSSGGPCISVAGSSPFCSQRCADDCTCPRGYTCAATAAGFSVCITGTNSCPTSPDGGTPEDVPPPQDAPAPDTDLRDTSLPPVDLGPPPDTGPGMEPPIAEMSGCGCRAPGSTHGALSLGVLALALLRRRRPHRPLR
ncbi:MAG: matrixin family metalloprotease [Deltaproteobacteria bacterium]|nr:matrixin family metalloprotease [Deltaproteobacteria bacterium]